MLLRLPVAKTIVRFMFRHPICGAVAIPILTDGRIVLVRRRDNSQWGLPGGMVEWGEDILTALRRELQEETGLQVESVGRLVGVYSSPDRDPRLHSICITISVTVGGTIQIQDTLEISEVKAFPLDSIPLDELSHDHKQQLLDYQRGSTGIA